MIEIGVDMMRCQHYGQCVLEAPGVFRLNAQDKLEYVAEVDDDQRDAVESAADICPMQAITVSP